MTNANPYCKTHAAANTTVRSFCVQDRKFSVTKLDDAAPAIIMMVHRINSTGITNNNCMHFKEYILGTRVHITNKNLISIIYRCHQRNIWKFGLFREQKLTTTCNNPHLPGRINLGVPSEKQIEKRVEDGCNWVQSLDCIITVKMVCALQYVVKAGINQKMGPVLNSCIIKLENKIMFIHAYNKL